MNGIGIVGAGIAGLSLAIALRQAGIEQVTLYDADMPASSNSPAESELPRSLLSISPNGTRVLRALGLRGALEALAEQPFALHQRSGGNGFLLSELPLGDLSAERYGAPFLHIGYETLRSLLLQTAAAEGVQVEGARTCIGQGAGELIFDDAQTRRHSLIAAADGTASVLRSGIAAPAQQPAVIGHQWQAQVPLQAVPESLRQNNVTLWLGPDQYVAHRVSLKHQRLYLSACTSQPLPDPEPSQFIARFRSWQPQLAGLLRNAVNHRITPLLEYPPPEALSAGNLALIGNAAHPMTPHLDQAASLALEDAWVLSRFIDQHEEDATMACAQYERYRLKRVRLFVERSAAEGAQRMATSGVQRSMTRLKTSLTSRFLPELAMQRLDWIYRYDCIRGFE